MSDWRRKLILAALLAATFALAPCFAFELLYRFVLRDVRLAPLATSDAPMLLQDALWVEAGERLGAGVQRVWLGNLIPCDHCELPAGFRVAERVARRTDAHRLTGTFFTAVWLSRHSTQSELESAYAATVYFGRGAWGLDAAARKFFGKRPAELSLVEWTTLVGQPQQPSRDPYCHPARAANRRGYILRLMTREGLVSGAAAVKALGEPVDLLPVDCSPHPPPGIELHPP